jgi:hypothetical protein
MGDRPERVARLRLIGMGDRLLSVGDRLERATTVRLCPTCIMALFLGDAIIRRMRVGSMRRRSTAECGRVGP